ncbi:MAG: YHYH protein [Rhodospirillaceae bacterium]|nr:YHYH protein [Rhodospirillaceae bacterium]
MPTSRNAPILPLLATFGGLMGGSASAATISFFQPDDTSGRIGYLGLYNRGNATTTVSVGGKDDLGVAAPGGGLTITLSAGATRVLSSGQLEQGVAGTTAITGRLGNGTGYWHLDVTSTSDVTVQNFVASTNGGLTETSIAAAPESNGDYLVHLFPVPGGASWAARLRIANPTSTSNAITITATDVSGNALSGSARITLGGNQAVELSASDLAQGNSAKGLTGSIATTNTTVWRLNIDANGSLNTFVVADTASGDIANVGAFVSARTTTAVTGTSSTAGVACPFNQTYTIASIGLTSSSSWTCSSTTRTMTSNALPNHTVGTFPNAGNPHAIAARSGTTFSAKLTPVTASSNQSQNIIGYALNGVKFEPTTAGACPSNITSTANCNLAMSSDIWRIEALGQTTFNFGVDVNQAHVQPTGEYHYHGVPEGLLTNAGASPTNMKMVLLGFAADGYPIYGRYGYTVATDATSALKVIRGSFAVDTVADSGRPSTALVPLGAFQSDWNYVAGSGDLDDCNGRFGVTPEFPNGIYHYYTTDTYPYQPRCLKGTIN